jgi:hypothetical protein
MGFDLTICQCVIKNGKAKLVGGVAEAYLSYNWGDVNSICLQHSLVGNGRCPDSSHCERIQLWYIRDDCFGRRGDDVEQRAQQALEKLEKIGIGIGQPDINNGSWGWGSSKGVRLPPKERLSVFAYHLDYFRQLGQQHPQCFFIDDDDDETTPFLILPDGEKVEVIHSSQSFYEEGDEGDETSSALSNESEVEKQEGGEMSRIVTYFRHPFKGNFRVDSFKTAMEIYGLLAAQNDSGADRWYELAFQMHDSPVA